jgi:hypothetical protein
MIWRWLIISSLVLGPWLAGGAGGVSGEVEITNSKEPAVRKNKDYSGVVLWLEPIERSAPAPSPRRLRMNQFNRHFSPHVIALPVGGTVDFPNLDPIFHNAFSSFSGQPFDIGLYPPGTTKSETFKAPGIVRVFCNIHPTMSAIIIVMATPWYAGTEASGRFNMPNVPAGEYQLRIFYERALPENLRFLERRISVPESGMTLPLISITETGFIPPQHLNKFGKPYGPLPNDGTYPGTQK